MTARTAGVEETRLRILDATLALHTEKGIFGTTWRDIAERADVSVGTVYRHFPTMAELVPACGQLLVERVQPPAPEDAAAAIGSIEGRAARVRRAAEVLYGFYDRAGASIESDPRERELPEVQEWEEYLQHTVATFAREALGDRASEGDVLVTSALLDHRTYAALRLRGLQGPAAADAVASLVAGRSVDPAGKPPRKESAR